MRRCGSTRSVDRGLALLAAFAYTGISQVEFKRDPRDGRYKLMEVNARLWQWHGLAGACGVDVPLIAFRDLTGGTDPAATSQGVRRRWAITLMPVSGRRARAPAGRRGRLGARRPAAGHGARRASAAEHLAVIPAAVERKARWVLDSIGAREHALGDDLPYRERAWEQLELGARPEGDELAEAFFHLARLEEQGRAARRARTLHRGPCLDPLDPPLERLRQRLGIEPPRWFGARFAIALSHDVDIPWRWTRIGVRGALRG